MAENDEYDAWLDRQVQLPQDVPASSLAEPASYRPDYMDRARPTAEMKSTLRRKTAERAPTPIALVRKPPASSGACLERTKPDSLKTA